MNWRQVFIIIIRTLIGDTDSGSYQYTDERVIQSAVVAGLMVSQQYQFPNQAYIFDFVNVNITPDPVINYDPVFIALVTLKAACLFMTETYQGLVKNIVDVQDGDSKVSTSGAAGAYAGIIKNGACQSYNELVDLLMRRKVKGRAVSSPFTSFLESETPFGGEGPWSVRSFFDGAFMFGAGGF